MRTRLPRPAPRWSVKASDLDRLLVAAIASCAVAVSAAPALAGHYHTYNNITHGIVHGSSDSDGSFFGRTYGYYFGGVNYCAVGHTSGGNHNSATYATGYTYNADLCSLWSRAYSHFVDECLAFSWNQVATNILGAHYHYAHSPPAPWCPITYT